MKLAYTAFDKSGRQVAATIEAANLAAASETLRRQGLYVTRIMPGGAAAVAAPARPRGSGKSRRLKNLAMLMRQLHALVSCGTPLVQAMGALERQTRQGHWRQAIADIRARVEEGAPLAIAMEGHPEYFDPICRSLVAAGESSGTLPGMMDRLATMVRKQLHIRNTVTGAMVYPVLLLGVAISVMGLMIVLVIPRFGELFKSLGAPLPPTTQALLAVSQTVQTYWWLALVLVVGTAVGLRLYLVSAAGRRALATVVLRLPQIGRIARNFATARIARLLGVLLESHVDILDALDLTRNSTGNHHYAALVDKVKDAVTSGKPISSAFSETDLVSPSVTEAIRSGEQSGQVGAMLLGIADFLDEENELVIRSLTSIIEPVILVLMGLLVGTVAVSLFLPLFDLTSMTQAQ